MPRAEGPEQEAVTFRIGRDVLALLRAEAMAEGQRKQSGRVYNPSATLDRILREHYADKLKAKRRAT
jgi:hypothetical protein